MAELADALDSGSSRGSSVKVQVLLPAPLKALKTLRFRGFSLLKSTRLLIVTILSILQRNYQTAP